MFDHTHYQHIQFEILSVQQWKYLKAWGEEHCKLLHINEQHIICRGNKFKYKQNLFMKEIGLID